jgi:fumarate hydratase class II
MMPLMAQCLLESIALLTGSARLFAQKCVRGLRADAGHCARLARQNPMLATALTPRIGYDQAARIARRAVKTGRPIREVAAEMTGLKPRELERLLDPARLT